MRTFLFSALLVFVSVFITLAVIYLTPLKNINVIPPQFNDVDPRAFYADFQAHPEKYLFIDVRDASEYARAHAPGSINMPLPMLYTDRASLPMSGKTIVLICTNGAASGVGFMYLQHYGYFNIERVSGGLEKWVSEGLPVVGTDISSIPGASSTTTATTTAMASPCLQKNLSLS